MTNVSASNSPVPPSFQNFRPGTRSKKTNSLGEYVNEGPSGLRLTISIGDLWRSQGRSQIEIRQAEAGGPDGSGPCRGYSSPKLMPNDLASRTRSL